MHGFHGQYLRVNLTNQICETVPLAEYVYRRFVGGVGLGTYLLVRESRALVDPLSPDAVLVFSFSPLVGTPFTTSAKFAVVGKSPLTFRLNDALSSSHFAIAGKKTGFDAIVITGTSSEPCVLVIDNGKVSFKSATHLWGLPAKVCSSQLDETLGRHFQHAAIGQAGENLVRFATISHGNRHAGRGGLGAVMGSKKLKAISVYGEKQVTLAQRNEIHRVAKTLTAKSLGPETAKYRELGTIANVLTFNRLNALPTRNFQQGSFEFAEEISGEAFRQDNTSIRESCAACTIGCEHIFQEGDNSVRLEYESLFALGPLCGIGDRQTILRAAQLCDFFGMDTISTGATIAFAMECSERGWLTENLKFGDKNTLLNLIEKICFRQEIGNNLADGTRMAATAIGKEASDIAPHVKGLELPGYEPRSLQTMALGLAVNSRGADHNRSGSYEADFSGKTNRLQSSAEKAILTVESEDRSAWIDSLILCKFLRGVFADLYGESSHLLALVTGWPVGNTEAKNIAKRIVTLKKLYNIREGWQGGEDTLPQRILREPLTNDKSTSTMLTEQQLKTMVAEYYRCRQWEPDGTISKSLIQDLELEDIVDF